MNSWLLAINILDMNEFENSSLLVIGNQLFAKISEIDYSTIFLSVKSNSIGNFELQYN